jgi:hypothetical protein
MRRGSREGEQVLEILVGERLLGELGPLKDRQSRLVLDHKHLTPLVRVRCVPPIERRVAC